MAVLAFLFAMAHTRLRISVACPLCTIGTDGMQANSLKPRGNRKRSRSRDRSPRRQSRSPPSAGHKTSEKMTGPKKDRDYSDGGFDDRRRDDQANQEGDDSMASSHAYKRRNTNNKLDRGKQH